MTSAPLVIIDGTRLTEERVRAARGPDAPTLASLAAVIAFAIACGLVAIAVAA